MPELEAKPQKAYISDILRHIPHRYPFIFLDRMEACESGKWIRASKAVSFDEWFLGQSPSERQVMPSMLIVEALAQTSGALSHYSGLMSQVPSPIMLFAGIDDCRFGIDAVPGDRLTLECTLNRSMRNVVKVSGRASVRDQMVVELQMTAVIQDRSQLGS